MKRIIAIVLSALTLGLLIATPAVFADPVTEEEANCVIQTVVSNSTVTPGSTFTVTANLTKNEGFSTITLRYILKSDQLEFVKWNEGTVEGLGYTFGKKNVLIDYNANPSAADDDDFEDYPDGNYTGTGELVSFTAKLKEGAPEGNYEVGFDLGIGGASDVDENDLVSFITTVSVEPMTVILGDLNGDTKVNGKDGVLCAQALAGWNVVYSEAAADVNGDGKFNGKDGILLAQYLAGWNVTLGKQS